MHRPSSPPSPPPLPRRGGSAARRDRAAAAPRRRGGFSFVEVLFAVVLLGLGFILIAAVFPVAISQSQTTMNETVGVSVTREAVRTIQSVAGRSLLISTNNYANPAANPVLIPFYSQNPSASATDILRRQALAGNQISSIDPRYGWIGFYRRDAIATPVGTNPPDGTPYAQVIVVACKNSDPNRETYRTPVSAPPLLIGDKNLDPVPVSVALVYGASGQPNGAILTQSGGSAPAPCDWADTGAFVVVATDTEGNGALVGRVYRLGASATAPDGTHNAFYLDPAYDMTPVAGTYTEARSALTAYIVGKAQQNPTAKYGTSPLVGGVQDIACQSTYIPLN